MSLIRSIFTPRASAGDSTNMQYFSIDSSMTRRTLSGEPVSPIGAMQLSVYFNCIRSIAEDVGKLPLRLFKVNANGGNSQVTQHPAAQLFINPNDEMSSMSFRETITQHALGWGFGIAEIQRNRSGTPMALHIIHPSRVRMRRINGDIFYDITMSDNGQLQQQLGGAPIRLTPMDVLHVHGIGDDGLTGISVARLAAESIGLALAAQNFGATFFGNGAHPSVVLSHPGKLSEVAQRNLRESWKKQYSGPENAHMPAVVEEGLTVTKISIPPNEAQMIETRTFQKEEIAGWFRMPLHKVGILSRSTLSNIEQQALEYLSDTLMPWFVRWEQELARKLLSPQEQSVYIIRHITTELLRGDATSRANYYRTMVSTGVMTPNEARAMENMNPVDPEVGDKLYMQGAMNTLDRIVEGVPPAQIQPPAPEDTSKADDSNAVADPTPGRDSEDVSSLAPVFMDAEGRVRRKEYMALYTAVKKFPANSAALRNWSLLFYREHADYVAAAFSAPVQSLAAVTGLDLTTRASDINAAIQSYIGHAQQHAASTGTQLDPAEPLATLIPRLMTMESPANA